jgi:hypothetical protein
MYNNSILNKLEPINYCHVVESNYFERFQFRFNSARLERGKNCQTFYEIETGDSLITWPHICDYMCQQKVFDFLTPLISIENHEGKVSYIDSECVVVINRLETTKRKHYNIYITWISFEDIYIISRTISSGIN